MSATVIEPTRLRPERSPPPDCAPAPRRVLQWVIGGLMLAAAAGMWSWSVRRPAGPASGVSFILPEAEVFCDAELLPQVAGGNESSRHEAPATPPVVTATRGDFIPVGQVQISATHSSAPDPRAPLRALSLARRTSVRISTYNMHGGKGLDRRTNLDRIATRLQSDDLVGLNEVRADDWFSTQPQVERLGNQLSLMWLFAPTIHQWGRNSFGNGVLSRWPAAHWMRVPLVSSRPGHERNVVLLSLRDPRQSLQVLITHLDPQHDRGAQLEAVAGLFASLAEPAVLLGDLNTTVGDPLLAPLLAVPNVSDALAARLPADEPGRIDWILTRGLHCMEAGRVAADESDHPYYWGRFAWPGEMPETAQEQTSSAAPRGSAASP